MSQKVTKVKLIIPRHVVEIYFVSIKKTTFISTLDSIIKFDLPD